MKCDFFLPSYLILFKVDMMSLHAQGHKYPWVDQLKMSHCQFLDLSKSIK